MHINVGDLIVNAANVESTLDCGYSIVAHISTDGDITIKSCKKVDASENEKSDEPKQDAKDDSVSAKIEFVKPDDAATPDEVIESSDDTEE